MNRLLMCSLYFILPALFFLSPAYAADPFTAKNQPPGYIQPMALSTFDLKGGAKGYRPWFENGAWQGDLVEYDISSLGAISTSVDLSTLEPRNTGTGANWSARLRFNAAEAANPNYWDARKIITWDGNKQVAFRWKNLSAERKRKLDKIAFNNDATTTSPILDFIRGDRSNEKPNGTLRTRYNLLGDIIHSNPVYVGAPAGNYSDSSYIAFQKLHASRAPRVYVGANDGMLHVFNAVTGDEVYAFIPMSVIQRLDNLSADPYSHTYYVDGELSVNDVYFDNAWHTVLIGSLGAGGSERFALDITDPNLSSETKNTGTDSKVMWIKTSWEQPVLGDAYGRASVVKLADGKYYSIVGNGYNSASGVAQLILSDIEDGTFTTISTNSGTPEAPNGLSTPSLIDIDGDGIYDYAYAGDLNGNLWKFDLKTKSLAYGKAIFSAGVTRPITTKVSVTTHPHGGKLIFFGTGKILSDSDLSDIFTQAIYGIWDKGTTPGTHSLLTQTLSAEKTISTQTIKTLSNAAIDWTSHTGWMVELTGGNRVVTNHQLRDGRIQTTVTNPINEENWLIEPAYLNGGPPPHAIFDIDGDGSLDHDDNVGGSKLVTDVAVAWKVSSGIMSGPLIARIANGIDTKFLNFEQLAVAPIACTEGCGFLGGHIDVDTDSPKGPNNKDKNAGYGGKTTAHTHEYDKKVNQPYVDYFEVNQGDAKQLQVDEILANDKNFIVIIANADLSSKSLLHIGTNTYNVLEYQTMIHRRLKALQASGTAITTLTDDDGNSLLVSINDIQANGGTLRNAFDNHSILDGGLHATNTGCVNKNSAITLGRWRNGALITQLIDPTEITTLSDLYHQNPDDLPASMLINGNTIVLKEDVDGDGTFENIYGGLRVKVEEEAGLLYESTLFWHYKGPVCYGDDTWKAAVAVKIKEALIAEFLQILEPYDDLHSIEDVTAAYDRIIATHCAGSSDIEQCANENRDQIDVDNTEISLGILINLIAIYDGVQDGPGSGDPAVPITPLVIVGGNESTGFTAGPNFIKGRRTWIDITDQ
ncbi:pilus assembly protein [Colwellia piezophila]|uniref:pilus assembly protein n=1 Tax=Colwellia piezophila TaxID=211668 RepID=UPI000365F41C|nr:PilC/PilY family type IV pilus protein [Colwellia piezophila]